MVTGDVYMHTCCERNVLRIGKKKQLQQKYKPSCVSVT